MSAIPLIPADFKIPPRFSYRPLFDILYQQMRRETRKSPEIEALKLGEWAFFFLTAFQAPPGSDYIAAIDAPPRVQVFTWPCYRSLSTMLPASFAIKQLDGNAISLANTPLRSVTSSLSVESLQMSSS